MEGKKGLLKRAFQRYKSRVEEYEGKRQSVLDRRSETSKYLDQLEDLGTPSNPDLVPISMDVRMGIAMTLGFQAGEINEIDRESKPVFYSFYKFLTGS